MSTPIEGKPILSISQSNLDRSNALRASMGLPPLQQITNVKVVTPEPKQVTGKDLAELQGRAANTISPVRPQENEAVSFMKIPFVGQKAGGTSQVPSTTIADPLQFIGFGAATKAAVKGGSILVGAIKSGSKPVVKEGAKDIGLSIKPSSDYLSSQRFERQTRTLPKPSSITPPRPTPPLKPQSTPPSFTSTNINLGRGIGFVVPKGGKGGGASNFFKPPPKAPEPQKPTSGKEVNTGKGLMQIVKEKPLTTQKQTQQFKEYPISLGKTTLQTVQKTKQTTKADQLMKDYLKGLQTLTLKKQVKQNQSQDIIFIAPQKTKGQQSFIQPQKQKQRSVGVILPVFRQSQKPQQPQRFSFNQKQSPVQRQSPVSRTSTIFTQPKIPSNTNALPKYDIFSPKTLGEPAPKKRLPFDGFLKFDSLNGGGGPAGGGGAKRSYIGNVPEFQFTGMFNRTETRYGRGTSVPRGYKITNKPASNAFTAFSRASGQGRKSGKQSKPKSLSNKFNRLI